MESVAVVGLGRVGLPLALSFADRGSVIGVERQRVAEYNGLVRRAGAPSPPRASTRALVTGGSGFAGGHLLERLDDPAAPHSREQLDLLDARATRRPWTRPHPR